MTFRQLTFFFFNIGPVVLVRLIVGATVRARERERREREEREGGRVESRERERRRVEGSK